jgi:sugar phosphate isomerase/epimerase
LLSSTALAAVNYTNESFAALTKTGGDPFHGLKVGVTSYTWLKFSIDQAIAMTKQAGAKYISLKEVHLPLKSTSEQRHEVHKKLEEAGLTLMGGGVIYFKNNEEEIQNVFEYAKDAGMATIVCSPDVDALDAVEKLVKKYDLKIAIHNHGPGDKKYPSPLDVMRLVKDRDSRMGVCMDVGHTVRIGQDPIEAIQQCASRLYEFHMKDVTAAVATGKATEVGRGVIDIVGVLKALVKLKWPYHLALEYEVKSENPLPGVVESFAYMRGILATL